MKKQNLFKIISFYSFIIALFIIGTVSGNKVVQAIAQNRPISRVHAIIIDPGHGGEDGGAVSCTGKCESSYNLEIAVRLNDFFQLFGYQTTMTRKSDISIYSQGKTIAQKKVSDLKERVRIANNMENAILLSIHQNKFPIQKYSGAQVFYGNAPQSKEFAERLQKELIDTLNNGSNRKIKEGSGIYILEQAQCPSILVECGFISNPTEERLLSTADYQKKLAGVIAISTISGLTI